ncbi:hypothetical protein RchiOBHm_Chr3g0497391 [Rosa chinensis]|uniref:Uncharacterized protein n=1 Tax=Rosa chinensis TaxID=74649 RepID=A0A2P6RHP7_ROSCH|nr:hypothetical protein RchiOBHm_Chr3g0497391 [Rosa chinensis]
MILCIPVNNKEDNVCISQCKSKHKFCFSWNELTNPTRLYHISCFRIDLLAVLFRRRTKK